MAKKKKEKLKPQQGLLVAIPLSDNTFGLAHMARVFELPEEVYSVTWGFYDAKVQSPDELKPENFSKEYLEKPVMVCSMDYEEFEKGKWPVVGSFEGEYTNTSIDDKIQGRMKWFNNEEKPGAMLLEMYLGILPWDLLHDPNALDKMLLPGYSRPGNVKLKKA
jgi:hypothetical protein